MTSSHKKLTRFKRRPLNVAIDGPAGVGKTTTARALADVLGILYVDTGAMYRALAVLARDRGISPDDEEGAEALAASVRAELKSRPREAVQVWIDGQEVTTAIRTREASDGASRISVHAGVRRRLVEWQRALARGRGVVMEGRDIGTVVLPEAQAKIFLTASPEERARRRHHELKARKQRASFASVLRDIQERDARDQDREASPLRPAADAVVIECTALGPEAQVDAVRRVVNARVATEVS